MTCSDAADDSIAAQPIQEIIQSQSWRTTLSNTSASGVLVTLTAVPPGRVNDFVTSNVTP